MQINEKNLIPKSKIEFSSAEFMKKALQLLRMPFKQNNK